MSQSPDASRNPDHGRLTGSWVDCGRCRRHRWGSAGHMTPDVVGGQVREWTSVHLVHSPENTLGPTYHWWIQEATGARPPTDSFFSRFPPTGNPGSATAYVLKDPSHIDWKFHPLTENNHIYRFCAKKDLQKKGVTFLDKWSFISHRICKFCRFRMNLKIQVEKRMFPPWIPTM